MRIGLCLSGGGARGAYHIGVLQALQEAKINIHIVSGTSAGALIGSLYCQGISPEEILKISSQTKWYHFIGPQIPNTGLADINTIQKILLDLIPHNSFDQLKIPLITTATNLESGQLEYFSSGELIKPVLASCAVPLVFKPVTMNGNKYLDGGILMNLPVEIIEDQCDYIIGSNLIPLQSLGSDNLNNYSSIMSRVLEINLFNNIKNQIPKVNLLIQSNEIVNYSRFDLTNANELFQLAYKEATLRLQEIM